MEILTIATAAAWLAVPAVLLAGRAYDRREAKRGQR